MHALMWTRRVNEHHRMRRVRRSSAGRCGALTEPGLLARWWAPGDIDPVAGHQFELDMGPWGRQACRVLEVEPERLLSYTFGEGAVDTTITWRLVPKSPRILLTAGNSIWTPLGRARPRRHGHGWPSVLARCRLRRTCRWLTQG